MKPLHEQVEGIATRADLVAFIEALRTDLEKTPEEWENSTVDPFLGALAAWTDAMQNLCVNQGRQVPQTPTWKTLGEMLLAARIYE